MDAEIKAKWLAALRSGKYQQGKDALRVDAEHFCCLGVLCDVIDPAKWIDHPHQFGRYRFGKDVSRFLPTEIEQELGLESHTSCLMGMNDSGLSFAEIADYIEKNL